MFILRFQILFQSRSLTNIDPQKDFLSQFPTIAPGLESRTEEESRTFNFLSSTKFSSLVSMTTQIVCVTQRFWWSLLLGNWLQVRIQKMCFILQSSSVSQNQKEECGCEDKQRLHCCHRWADWARSSSPGPESGKERGRVCWALDGLPC